MSPELRDTALPPAVTARVPLLGASLYPKKTPFFFFPLPPLCFFFLHSPGIFPPV